MKFTWDISNYRNYDNPQIQLNDVHAMKFHLLCELSKSRRDAMSVAQKSWKIKSAAGTQPTALGKKFK